MKKKLKLSSLTKKEMSKVLGSLGEASGPVCICACLPACTDLGLPYDNATGAVSRYQRDL